MTAAKNAAVPAKILIAEDNEEQYFLIDKVLQRHNNWILLRAHTGIETIEILERENPDMVLLDMLMPDFNGMDVLQHIHVSKNLVPIIVMSGSRIDLKRNRNLAKIVSFHMTKPLNFEDLLKNMESILEQNRLKKTA